VSRAQRISVLDSRSGGSLVMPKACSMPQAHATGQTDRRVGVPLLHPGLAVAAAVENCNRQLLRALYTDRRERTQPHQYLAVAGDDQHAAIGLGQREAEPDHRGPHARGYPGDDVPVKPYSRMNRVTSVTRVAAQDVLPGSVADGQWPRPLRSEP
jgi:hypothetical protein